jgi:FkbM family methyltransferase
LGKNPLRFNDIVEVKINTDTIDNLFYDNDIPIHFIKMDTEGWEYNILKGGEKSLKKYRPIMQIEWNQTNMQQCDINIEPSFNGIVSYRKL